MKIFLAGLILSCALAVTVSQNIPPPSSNDLRCVQRVAVRDGLSGCSGLISTDIQSICSNKPCVSDVVRAYRSCGRSDLAAAIDNLCEQVAPIGLIVGLSVAGFILLIVVPITIFCIVACCITSRRRTHTTTTTATMSAAPYAVTYNSSSSQQAYPNTLQEKAPPPYADPQRYAPYPPQQ